MDTKNDVVLNYCGFKNAKEYSQALKIKVHEANLDVAINTNHAGFFHEASVLLDEYKKWMDTVFVENEDGEIHKNDLIIKDTDDKLLLYDELSDVIKSEITIYTNYAIDCDSFFVRSNKELIYTNKSEEINQVPDVFSDTQILELAFSCYYSITYIVGKELHIKRLIFYKFCEIFNHVPKTNAMKEFSRIPTRSHCFVAFLNLLVKTVIKEREKAKEAKRKKARIKKMNREYL